jgi:Ca-activated chloride channel family protein
MKDGGAPGQWGSIFYSLLEKKAAKMKQQPARMAIKSTLGIGLVVFFLLAVPFGVARFRQTGTAKAGQDDQKAVRLNVDLVVLHATVQDHKRTFVSGLGKENFQVYEDGAVQQIESFSHEDIPVTVGLVVDNSGSMRPKLNEVILAAQAFARSSNPRDQLFEINFNEKVYFGLPPDQPFASNADGLNVALYKIRALGETALYDAVAAALDHLKKGDRDKKVLIVISDGGDNASRHKLDQVMAMAKESEAIIYTIGLFDDQDIDRNPRVLKELAKDTGGEAFLPGSLEEIVPICERIARDIRSQYTITYVPANPSQDGKYRVVTVKANTPAKGQLFVRTRAGYFAPGKP